MNPHKTLILIGHPTEAVQRAKDLGLDVILLQHKSKFAPVQAELADVLFLVDYTDWSVTGPLVEMAHERWGFSAAVSLTDPGLEIAGRINDRYGLGGTGYRVAHLLRDKWAMRRHLTAVGAPTVAADLVDDEAGMRRFGDSHGYPFIVKPVDLAGGFGVLKVAGPADVPPAWQQVLRMRRTGLDRGPRALFLVERFLMEQYIEGPEFSVEAFSFAGRHVVVSVTEKLTEDQHFAELGHTVPGRVDADTERRIVDAVSAFLDAVGLADGPSHTEIRVSPRGPLVIESHNRAGGDRIRDLVRAVYGVDFTAYALGWPFGLVDELTARPTASGGACVRFLRGTPGRIASIDGVEQLNARPDVLAAEVDFEVGDLVGPLRDDFDRLGLIAVTAPDSDAAVRLCDDLVERAVDIRIEAPDEVAA